MESTIITDISDYQENFVAGMNGRQVVLAVVGVLIIVFAYMNVQEGMGTQLGSYLAILGGLPCFLFAFARPKKMNLEQYIYMVLESEYLSNSTRYFEAENWLYEELFDEIVPEKVRKGGKKIHGDME